MHGLFVKYLSNTKESKITCHVLVQEFLSGYELTNCSTEIEDRRRHNNNDKSHYLLRNDIPNKNHFGRRTPVTHNLCAGQASVSVLLQRRY